MLPHANAVTRQTVPASNIVIGLQCDRTGPTQTVGVQIRGGTGYAVGTNNPSATASIIDDELPPETPLFEKGRELYGLPQARQAIRDAGRVLVVANGTDANLDMSARNMPPPGMKAPVSDKSHHVMAWTAGWAKSAV